MSRIKKILCLALTIVLLAGCAQQKQKQIARYTAKNVPAGIYVFRDGYYYSLYNFNNASPTEEVQWQAGESYLIPHLGENDSLVLFTNDVVPTEIEMMSLIDFGPTVGVRFSQYLDTDKFTIPDKENYQSYCPTSVQLAAFQQALPSLENIRIEEIADETQHYPFTKQLISSKGLLKGLSEGALYNLYVYQGTEYHELKIKADTNAYILDKTYLLKNYVELKDKHFNIKLPKNLTTGYWMISAGDFYGCFYLEPNVELFGEEMIEKEAELEQQQEEPSQDDLLDEIDIEFEDETSSENTELQEDITTEEVPQDGDTQNTDGN